MRVANDKMAGAIRLVSLQRGHDPRDFVLFAFGGAGPLHAVGPGPRAGDPAGAGAGAARDHLGARLPGGRRAPRLREDRQPGRAAPGPGRGARASWPPRWTRGAGMLASEGVEVETVSVQHEADMQFVGQTHVLTVPVARTDFAREDLMRAFERAYWERFEVELREMRAQVVSLRTAVIGRRRPVSLEGLIALERRRRRAGRVPADRRRAWFDGRVARHAGVPAGAARRRRGARRAGHRRAARLHHRDRAGRPGARGCARQPRDHRPGLNPSSARPVGRGSEHDGRDRSGHAGRRAERPAAGGERDGPHLRAGRVLAGHLRGLRPLRRHLLAGQRRGHRPGRAGAAHLRGRHAVHDARGDRAREGARRSRSSPATSSSSTIPTAAAPI